MWSDDVRQAGRRERLRTRGGLMAKSAKIAVTSLEQSPSHLLHRALQLALDLYAVETGPGAGRRREFAAFTIIKITKAMITNWMTVLIKAP